MLSQLLKLFGFFSLVLVLVYWINRAVSLFDKLIADGHSALVFLEFTALTLPGVIRLVLPISAFAAAVYVTNRMSNESELVVMQTGGSSPWRLARPVAVFAILCATLTLVLTHIVVPASMRALTERTAKISEDVTVGLLSEGAFLHPANGITVYIGEITPETELRDVFLSDSRNPNRNMIYTAQRALLIQAQSGPQFVMFNALLQSLNADGQRLTTTRFDDLVFDLGTLVTLPGSGVLNPQEVPTGQLLAASDGLMAATGRSRAALIFEGHERVTQGLFALVTPLVGFAAMLLGRFSRFGAWRQLIGAVCCLIAVELLDNLAADIAISRAGAWPIAYGAFIIGLGLSAALLWLAGRPDGWATRRLGQAA